MKATLVRLMAISTLAVAGFPAPSLAADVTGTWNVSASTTDPCDYSGQMTLEQTGRTFIGVASLSSDSGFPCHEYVDGSILSGSISGLDVSFTFAPPIFVSRALTLSGALTPDQMTMSGEFSTEFISWGTWSATRVTPCEDDVSQAPEGCARPAVAFVRALAIYPTTPRTLYAGTGRYFGDGSAIGGVLKSTDGGSTWSASNTGLSLLSPVYVLAIDPTTPRTLYAGTHGSLGRTGGVYKSTDAGRTWMAANTGLPTTELSVVALAIDSTTPSTLYMGADSYGVYKSTDGGTTWRPANSGLPGEISVLALAIDPSTPNTLYAGAGYGGGSGVYKSTDGGSTWGPVSTGGSTLSVHALAIDSTPAGVVYAATAYFGVLKSTDGGSTWSGADYLQFMETRLFALAIDATTPGTLYAAGDGVYQSRDGGDSWHWFDVGLPATHIDALAIDPTTMPSTLYVGTNAGVFSIQPGAGCIGDCGGDGTVSIDELLTGVGIALHTLPLSQCPSFDTGDDNVTVDELITGVHNALSGCLTSGME